MLKGQPLCLLEAGDFVISSGPGKINSTSRGVDQQIKE